MVVALIALFVSLTGNAAAVSYFVSSKQIKDGTIQVRDISPAARAALRGSQGPQGLRGYTGPQGIQGNSYDSYTITRDLRNLCAGIGKAQKEIDGINPVAGRYAAYWPYGGDFRYSSCSYYGY